MEYATGSSRTSTCTATTTQDSSKQNEELVEKKLAKAILIMPIVTTALHEQRQKSGTFNGHAALIKNITKFGLQVCINCTLRCKLLAYSCLWSTNESALRAQATSESTKRSC